MFRSLSVFLLLAVALLAACGKSEDRKPATQVAAKVNGDEISVHQINTALMQAGAVGDPKNAAHQVLERLIDQQLLVQKAIEAKLDRDPNVVTAIENSRRQILAQAYIERTLTNAAMPSSDDIKKYYAEHPELFGQRRLYRFQEVLAGIEKPEQLHALQTKLEKTHDMREVTTWLNSQGIRFNLTFSLKASEQLPRNLLLKLKAMKPGDIMFYPAGNRALIVQLTSWQELPLSEPEAAPYIVQVLVTQKRGEQANEEVKRLRTAAKVEYVGDYAKTASAAETPAPASGAKQQSLAAEAKAQSPTAPTKQDPPTAADKAPLKEPNMIDKGLSGLK